jgi:hypothetical protein
VTALLLLLAGLASAQTEGIVRRGEVQARVPIRGTVIGGDVFRLKSPIEGRIAVVNMSTYTWYDPDHILGMIADTELSAMMDAHGSTGNDVLEERWQRVYKPTKIHCPSECFILRSFIKPRQLVKPHALLVEFTRSMTMVGHVRLEHTPYVKFNQPFQFWAVKDPQKKMSARVVRFKVIEHDPNKEPGGHVEYPMDRSWYMDPGTEWEGVIEAELKKKVLTVPNAALVVHNGVTYLPVAVSTGIATEEITELVGGVDENTRYLTLDAAKLGAAVRKKYEPPPLVVPAPPAPVVPPKKRKKEEKRDDSLPPDPYEE